MPPAVGLIGLGEAGSAFAAAMRGRGVEVTAYDLDPDKVLASGVSYRPLPDLVGGAQYVLSTVTTAAAIDAAKDCVPYLTPRHVYVDLNSTAPSVKVAMAGLIRPTNARFVEAAILGAVGVTGARTRILAGGPAAREAAEALTSIGLSVSFYSERVGQASTFKMLRGIFSKGLEALLIELLVSGKRAGIDPDLWRDVAGFMAANPFEAVAENWVQSHAVAFERRYHELVQIGETMRELGVEPVMTAATERFFDRSRSLGLETAFPAKPASMHEVIAFFDRVLHNEET